MSENPVSGKIDDALLRRLETARRAGPGQRIPVIVTLAEGADAGAVEAKGLQQISQHLPIYAGELGVAEIEEIARWQRVERIEYDSPASAL